MGDPVVRLADGVNFEIFKNYLNTNLHIEPAANVDAALRLGAYVQGSDLQSLLYSRYES